MGRKIKETECTCNECGNVWYFDKSDVWEYRSARLEEIDNALDNVQKNLMCCCGCLPALFIPDKKNKNIIPLDMCDECGSRNVTQEKLVHYVE